ncbi:MAG TPA: DJ-1/PfpI family protein [Myxococcaceae bacterium]|nr:DJ-1/PfpI family protein [Myxococcaceae bacterium]
MADTTVGFLVFPDFTQLDLTGPYEVFSRMPNVRVELVGTEPGPIRSERGLTFQPRADRAAAPRFDVLCIPGGLGVNELLQDDRVLDWVADAGGRAELVTSVCTGALVLGAAGLLRGYRATTHWLSLDLLTECAAIPVGERVVRDRNRVTGAGITAGIDFGLAVVAQLHDQEAAEKIQLMMEYDPAPPFHAGSPRTAPAALVERIKKERSPLQDERRRLLVAAVNRRARA